MWLLDCDTGAQDPQGAQPLGQGLDAGARRHMGDAVVRRGRPHAAVPGKVKDAVFSTSTIP